MMIPSTNFTPYRPSLPLTAGVLAAPSGANATLSGVSYAAGAVTPTTGATAVPTEAKNDAGKLGKAEKPAECQTCKNRKYIDGSDEGNVSFKTPGHIAPEASASTVRAHEGEHVQNAKREGQKPGNKLISASVSLKTAICPECGRAYVAGGTTRTRILYGNSDYDKNKKALDQSALVGANVDIKA